MQENFISSSQIDVNWLKNPVQDADHLFIIVPQYPGLVNNLMNTSTRADISLTLFCRWGTIGQWSDLRKVTTETGIMKPWIWIAAGIALAALELIVPSFTIIWFGLAGVIVGILSFLLGTESLTLQMAMWAVLSGLLTFFWFRFFRQETKTFSGQGKDAIIGKSGIVIRVNDTTFPGGVIRFPIAVLGSDEWTFTSEEHLQVGDRAIIKDIAGDRLVVIKG
jgi:inner membrane protein